jgi:integrase
MRGDGSIYLRGRVYWYSYYREGKHECESLKTADPKLAERRAKKIRDGLLDGTIFGASERRVTVNELLDDLVTHLSEKQRAYVKTCAYFIARLRRTFGARLASQLDTASIERFRLECRENEGLAVATIDRHCELLGQAFRLGRDRTPPKVSRVPMIPLQRPNNARQGFVPAADFFRILNAVRSVVSYGDRRVGDPDLADYLEWFWWTGMRPGEISHLTWSMFDAETWEINLAPHAAKTGEARTLPCESGHTHAVIKRRLARRIKNNPLIFHRFGGRPVSRYRSTWAAACRAVGLQPGRKLGGLTPYDLRRSAVRNIVRSGTDFTVAMKISGHKTRSTFDRYNITSAEDIRAAMKRTSKYVEAMRRKK